MWTLALDASPHHPIRRVSSPEKAQRALARYLGRKVPLYLSTRKKHKYMVWNPRTESMVHFGHMDYEDYTRHQDKDRRASYLQRAKHIRGSWRRDPWSPNNLAIHVLW